jgi:hypothetical protein
MAHLPVRYCQAISDAFFHRTLQPIRAKPSSGRQGQQGEIARIARTI